MLASKVIVDCRKIHDWNSFHHEFERVFGFPAFYGRNMNAWIDCMASLDAPDDGMTMVHCAPGELLTIELNHASSFKVRCPEQFEALIHCSNFVNERRVEVGESAVLTLSFER